MRWGPCVPAFAFRSVPIVQKICCRCCYCAEAGNCVAQREGKHEPKTSGRFGEECVCHSSLQYYASSRRSFAGALPVCRTIVRARVVESWWAGAGLSCQPDLWGNWLVNRKKFLAPLSILFGLMQSGVGVTLGFSGSCILLLRYVLSEEPSLAFIAASMKTLLCSTVEMQETRLEMPCRYLFEKPFVWRFYAFPTHLKRSTRRCYQYRNEDSSERKPQNAAQSSGTTEKCSLEW